MLVSVGKFSLTNTVSLSLSICRCISSACMYLPLVTQHSCWVVHARRREWTLFAQHYLGKRPNEIESHIRKQFHLSE
jgi:hypothetical protein